jgi:sporulation protein YlmC with PRC-barrel domain
VSNLSWETELAKEFKNRNNPAKIGTVLGNVLSLEPLKIGILNNQIILDKSNSYIGSILINDYQRKANMKISAYDVSVNATDSNGDSLNQINFSEKNDYNVEIAYKDILQIGDQVLIMASDDNQTFYILDKVYKIE